MKISIIGAGLSGLVLGHSLSKHHDVTIYEKSRGFGGRMATRTRGEFQFDHGCQFFTAQSNEFKNFLKPFIEDRTVQHWQARFAEIDASNIKSIRPWREDYPHYVSCNKMTSLARKLAEGLEIQREHKVESLEQLDSDITLITAPPEQTLALLSDEFKFINEIQQIDMKPCFALMLGFDQPLELDFDAAHVKNSQISWISQNSSKPDRTGSTLVVHSTNAWAAEHLEEPIETVMDSMILTLKDIIEIPKPKHIDCQRWRFANADKQTGQKSFYDETLKLGVCGDWCVRGRVEAAFLSATDLLQTLERL